MIHPLEELRDAALAESTAAPNEQVLEAVRVRYLGRSGSISAWGEQMKSLSKEERPVVGKLLNRFAPPLRQRSRPARLSPRGPHTVKAGSLRLASSSNGLPGAGTLRLSTPIAMDS